MLSVYICLFVCAYAVANAVIGKKFIPCPVECL